MKQRIYNLLPLLLCLIFSALPDLKAQTNNCKRDFTIKTTIVNSTCAANGTVTVTLEGDLSELDLSKTKYGLEPVSGSTGSSKLPSENNPITAVAPGTYTLSVRTYCKGGDTNGVVTELKNVVVGGSYTAPMPEYDQTRSRISYKGIPTGIIAFNIKEKTGNGTLKFYILEAPTGVQLGEFTPTKSTWSGYHRYTMPGFYPPGTYKIQVLDDCGGTTATINFTEALESLPEPVRYTNGTQGFNPSHDGSCNKVGVSLYASKEIGNAHYQAYQKAGMYEVAVVMEGQTPSESDWQDWEDTSSTGLWSSIVFTLPSGSYSDYYPNYTIGQRAVKFDTYARLKGYPEFQYKSTRQQTLSQPRFTQSSPPDYYCDRVEVGVYALDGFYCLPVKIKVYDQDSGEIYDEVVQETTDANNRPKVAVPYDRNIVFDYTDALGFNSNNLNYPKKYTYKRDFNVRTRNKVCESFDVQFSFNYNNTYHCDPAIINVYKADAAGEYTELVKTYSLNFTENETYTPYETYPTGKYKAIASFPNVVTDNPQTAEGLFEHERKIFSYTLSASSSTCTEKTGSLSIKLPNTTDALNLGGTYTVVEAPDGYPLLGVVHTVKSAQQTYSISAAYMPSGKYTVEINDGCGDIQRVSGIFNDIGYSTENVKVVIDDNLCEGAYLSIDGLITLEGEEKQSNTWFKLAGGPAGYDNTVKAYNGKVLLTADGEYIVALMTSRDAVNTCYLRRDTINYVKSAPLLAPAVTAAYKCEDNPEPFIIVKGQGGSSPYTYELLNIDKTPTGATPRDIDDGSGRIVFEYGESEKTYIVRITDVCGNFSDQEIYVANLSKQNIIYNIPASGEYCSGDTIRLNCITLGQTQYKWEGPNGFISYEQNPRIYPTDPALHTGTYKVTVTPELCGDPITDEVFIEVFHDLTITGVSEDQEICTASRGKAMSCSVTGGKGVYKYQWQISTDEANWVDVVGATASTYEPIQRKSGTYYYRAFIKDDCRALYSGAITVNIKPCSIFVNPNLMHKFTR